MLVRSLRTLCGVLLASLAMTAIAAPADDLAARQKAFQDLLAEHWEYTLSHSPEASVWSRSHSARSFGLPSQWNISFSSVMEPTSRPMSALGILNVEAGRKPLRARASSVTR